MLYRFRPRPHVQHTHKKRSDLRSGTKEVTQFRSTKELRNGGTEDREHQKGSMAPFSLPMGLRCSAFEAILSLCVALVHAILVHVYVHTCLLFVLPLQCHNL